LVALLLSIAMVLSLFFVVVGAQRAIADGTYPPTGIHLTWNENENKTASTIVVTWETASASSGDNVKYDVQSKGGNPDNYSYSAVGSNHNYSGSGGYIHDVELTGLSPNTVYYFVCGGANGGYSTERSFRTAPNQSTSFRFVAGGDSRSGSSDWPGSRDSVSRAMAKFNPSFVLFGGDFVASGSNDTEWDNWFAAAQMYWVDNNNRTIPIIPTFGNHEMLGDSGVSYLGQLSLPGNEEWYSLNWGPNLHIIVLDSEDVGSIAGAQRDWLQQDLAAHANYLWKIAIFHKPVYSRNAIQNNGPPGGSGLQIAQYWAPLFDQYHVDLVIGGHTHLYEREKPVYENNPVSSPENGTVYVVEGGWGAPLSNPLNPGTYTAYGPDENYSFTTIDILNTEHFN
jgi:hypothetical protein